MITNELLNEKYRVQSILSERSGDSIADYVSLIHSIVKKTENDYGIKFEYVSPKRHKNVPLNTDITKY